MSGGVGEPSPRWNHFSTVVEELVVLYGGRTRNVRKEKRNLSSRVHLFDPYQESWCEATTQGPTPPGLYNGACASSGHNFFVFGGIDEAEFHPYCSLHQLDTSTLRWSILSTTTGPMRKVGSRMISYDDQLLLFGGYGVPSGSTQPGAEFVEFSSTSTGWTNELHTFWKGGEGRGMGMKSQKSYS